MNLDLYRDRDYFEKLIAVLEDQIEELGRISVCTDDSASVELYLLKENLNRATEKISEALKLWENPEEPEGDDQSLDAIIENQAKRDLLKETK